MNYGGRKGELLLHAMGIVGNEFFRLVRELHKFKQLGGAAGRCRAVKAIHASRETEEFGAGEAPEQSHAFGHDADLALHFDGMSVEIEPENFDSSGTGCKQSGEHLDRGRFPCAVGAQEAEELSRSNAQVHAVHGNEFSETAGQALSADGGGKIHQFSESSTPTGFSRGDYLSFFGASFFSGCFFCISSVQGGTIPTT